MTNYKELYEKAIKDKKLTQLTCDIHKWQHEGDMLVGQLHRVKDFEGGKFDSKVKEYLIQTDSGLKSIILGAATDKQIEGKIQIDDVIVIEYKGQVELDGGRRCNRFIVSVI